MKKILLLICMLFFLNGCESREEHVKRRLEFAEGIKKQCIGEFDFQILDVEYKIKCNN